MAILTDIYGKVEDKKVDKYLKILEQLRGILDPEFEGIHMVQKANLEDVFSFREALHMEIIINKALIDLLVSKGVITQEELMKTIEKIRKESPNATC